MPCLLFWWYAKGILFVRFGVYSCYIFCNSQHSFSIHHKCICQYFVIKSRLTLDWNASKLCFFSIRLSFYLQNRMIFGFNVWDERHGLFCSRKSPTHMKYFFIFTISFPFICLYFSMNFSTKIVSFTSTFNISFLFYSWSIKMKISHLKWIFMFLGMKFYLKISIIERYLKKIGRRLKWLANDWNCVANTIWV